MLLQVSSGSQTGLAALAASDTRSCDDRAACCLMGASDETLSAVP